MARKTQAPPKLNNPYKDSLDDITDEPGFASALREVEMSDDVEQLDELDPSFTEDDEGDTRDIEGNSVRKITI